MPYITRNEENKITAIFACKQYENQEFLVDDNEEVLIFEGKVKTLETLKQEKLTENIQKREERFTQGAVINGHKLDINTEAKANFTGLVISGIESINYMDFDSNEFVINKSEFQSYVQGFLSITKAVYAKDKEFIDAIHKAITKEEVASIIINYSNV